VNTAMVKVSAIWAGLAVSMTVSVANKYRIVSLLGPRTEFFARAGI
jgi:hypothetical protein